MVVNRALKRASFLSNGNQITPSYYGVRKLADKMLFEYIPICPKVCLANLEFFHLFQTLANRLIPLTEHYMQLPLVQEKCQV